MNYKADFDYGVCPVCKRSILLLRATDKIAAHNLSWSPEGSKLKVKTPQNDGRLWLPNKCAGGGMAPIRS